MAGISAVYQALITRWNAQNLDDLFPGGIWFGEAEPGVDWPYAVFVGAGNGDGTLVEGTEFRDHLIQISLYFKSDGLTDPVITFGGILDTVVSKLFQAPLSISGSGQVLYCRRTREDIRKDPENRQVWIAEADFKIRRTQAYDSNPN